MKAIRPKNSTYLLFIFFHYAFITMLSLLLIVLLILTHSHAIINICLWSSVARTYEITVHYIGQAGMNYEYIRYTKSRAETRGAA